MKWNVVKVIVVCLRVCFVESRNTARHGFDKVSVHFEKSTFLYLSASFLIEQL